MILAKAWAGKTVQLTPDTAMYIGLQLETVAAKPSRAEVIKMICNLKCETPCMTCTGKANVIVRAYGQRLE